MYDTREEWLNAAMRELEGFFTDVGVKIPGEIRVSCAWAKRPGKAIGWCWRKEASTDRTNEIQISPELDDPVKILAVLVHEMIHASDNGASKHVGKFKQVALAVGLEGKMTATMASPELLARLEKLATTIGPYPHSALNPMMDTKPKQTTRMIKVVCPDCGYTVRASHKWIEIGLPTCPCGNEMEAD
jgi:hypothetical protein